MPTLLELDCEGVKIYVDTTPPGVGVSAAGAAETIIKASQASFDHIVQVAKVVGKKFQTEFATLGVNRAEVELGFQFTGKGTVFLVQSEAAASIKVKLMFEAE